MDVSLESPFKSSESSVPPGVFVPALPEEAKAFWTHISPHCNTLDLSSNVNGQRYMLLRHKRP